MNPELFKEKLSEDGFTLTEKQMEQFHQYLLLLQE